MIELMVQPQVHDRPKLLFVDRILGWFTEASASPAPPVLSAPAEEFDFYAAEEALLDN
jgi:hypothetical protein